MKKKSAQTGGEVENLTTNPPLAALYTQIPTSHVNTGFPKEQERKNNKLVVYTLEMKVSTFSNSFDQSEHIQCQFSVTNTFLETNKSYKVLIFKEI